MRFFLIIIIILLPSLIFSQIRYQTGSKKAIGHFENALKYFELKDDVNAIKCLEKALKTDNKFIEAYMMMAQIYKDREEYDRAIHYFRTGLDLKPDFNPAGYLVLANVEFNQGMYNEALEHARRFISLGIFSKTPESEGMKFIENCLWAMERFRNPVPFNPVNLGDSVNSTENEYWPSLSIDENTLIITVLDSVQQVSLKQKVSIQEDFYKSIKHPDGQWGRRSNIGPPINTADNEGAQTISADGKFLFFTGCNRADGKGLCDIYFSKNVNGRWSLPVNLGSPVNTSHSEKHPSISPDGRCLYFVSDRPGTFGGLDIWVSRLRKDGQWSLPENLGDSVNTPFNERSPFIHSDNQTLYFSSDGHRNMGQGDIFFSRLNNDKKWGSPVNLGYPINTFNMELGLIVNAAGDMAYFASDRIKGKGLDIYKFQLYPEARPIPVSYMKGRVYDAKTWKGIEALFQLIDLETGEVVVESVSSPVEGDFLISLPVNRDYALNISKPGYLFYSDHFSFRGIHERTNPYIRDVPLNPVRQGEKIILKNIFYSFDSWDLLPESRIELNKVIEFMVLNPDIKIEISGHTDSVGLPSYNFELSEKRARSVVEYLISSKISPDRLTYKGFGASQPVQTNDTEEGRAMNRRTELKVIN